METSQSFFNIFWDVLWQFCYQIQSQVLWQLHIYLFEIQGRILWLIHCRDSFARNTKAHSVTVTPEIHLFECLKVVYSAIFDYKVEFLNKKLCSINCGWLKETFWQYVTIHWLDKYNTMFQNVKRVLHQNKAHTKIS